MSTEQYVGGWFDWYFNTTVRILAQHGFPPSTECGRDAASSIGIGEFFSGDAAQIRKKAVSSVTREKAA